MFGNRISGKWVVTGLIGFTIVFGMGFWWFQEHAFYEEFQAAEHVVEIDGWEYPVTGWKQINSESSPLKMRACFLIQVDFEAREAPEAMPLVAPGWFRCFNAEVIAENLQRKYATAYIAQRNDPEGFDRIIAVFPGGRAYMWRQPEVQIDEISG
jgi:hypothetical protein